MHRVPMAEARTKFGELINRAKFGGEVIVLTRAGRDYAAIVPLSDPRVQVELEKPGKKGRVAA